MQRNGQSGGSILQHKCVVSTSFYCFPPQNTTNKRNKEDTPVMQLPTKTCVFTVCIGLSVGFLFLSYALTRAGSLYRYQTIHNRLSFPYEEYFNESVENGSSEGEKVGHHEDADADADKVTRDKQIFTAATTSERPLHVTSSTVLETQKLSNFHKNYQNFLNAVSKLSEQKLVGEKVM